MYSLRRTLLVGVVVVLAGQLLGSSARASASGSTVPLISRVRLGAYVDGMASDPGRLSAFESRLGVPMGIASVYHGFGDLFPAQAETDLSAHGARDVLAAWDMGATRFTDWSSGRYDSYLQSIGALAAKYSYPLYLRPWPEMNGDWQDFQPTADGQEKYGGTPGQFIAAWRHVVNKVRAAGGTNVRWVFNPTADTYAETTDVRTIWPGAAYVDVLGLDGFNWGTGGILHWRSFTDIFTVQYSRLVRLHPTAPVWVCEFGSKEPTLDDGAPVDPANDKGRWLTSALTTTSFPRIAALVFFDMDKERDWRVSSSLAAEGALHTALATRGS